MSVFKKGRFYQELHEARNMVDAYEEWEDYRKIITKCILDNTESGKTIAILGAGRSNDIDLSKLANHFSRISLIDNDKEAMEDALKRYNLTSEEIDVVVKDFVGISDDDYNEYEDIILREIENAETSSSLKDFGTKAIEKLDSIYSNIKSFDVDLGDNKYDYVVAIGIHSQLNSTFAWLLSEHIIPEHTCVGKKVEERIAEETDYIVNKFDNAIYKTAKEKVFIGCENDIIGIGIPINGASNEIINIKKLYDEGIIKDGKYYSNIVWSFDISQERQYNMLFFILEVPDSQKEE